MPINPTTEADIAGARAALSAFVERQAEETAARLGFGWIPSADSPSTYPQLCVAYDFSLLTKQPLPVSSSNMESVIYTSLEANLAMRFWHDVSHAELQLTFDLVDEVELGLWHLDQIEQAGFGPDTLPWRMLHADTIGQALLLGVAKQFPADQERFVERCIVEGVDHGLLSEARLVQVALTTS